MKKIIYLTLLLSQLLLGSAWAQQAFVVKNIEIEGLQNISSATVRSYLPVKTGQTLQPSQTGKILRALYQTGFFDHITLAKQGQTLVIHVIERPTIGQLKLSGNSVIPTDKLTSVMNSLDVAEGRVYNPVVLERIKQSLLNQYYQLGRYNAQVTIATTPMTRNRIRVVITISEGLVAKIQRISIMGNHVFPEKELVKQLDISSTNLFAFFTQSDRYSEEKLEASLEKLRNYYLDRGYLKFEIKSSQAEITPDRKGVYINIVVAEGERYTIDKYELEGQMVVPRSELLQRITVKPGQPFSKKDIMDSEKSITNYLGDKGYMFATVSLHPQVNEANRTVTLLFEVKPGKRTYVRHVTFANNTHTNDVVLRREIQQMEAAPVAVSKLDDSKQRLSLLPYIKTVDMSIHPVEDNPELVDVNYKVEEESTATASFKVGYSQIYRTVLGVGFNQKNFFGTGNTLGVNLSRSKYEQFYGIDYTNPYYTEDGISRTFSFAISRVDPAGAGINVGFTTSQYDLGVFYGIPLGEEQGVYSRLQAGLAYQNTLVTLLPSYASNQVNQFVNQHGRHFQELDMRLGYSRDSRDKAVFPTSGMLQTLYLDAYAPLASKSLSFYTLNYHGKWYQPLTNQFIVLTKGNLGYGNGLHGIKDFPFFKNFYAGGIDSVRGYEGFTLGPRDSKGNPFGGNMLVDGSLGLIFPNYISDSLRTSVFVDAGNVYGSNNNRSFGGESTNSGPLRFSAGIEADVLTPFGNIEVTLAQALNPRKGHGQISGDSTQVFQFALGANF